MKIKIRKSSSTDLEFLEKLENESFPIYQRATKKSIKLGLESDFQEVYIAENNLKSIIPLGATILFKYPKSIRIYSIAVLPEFQNQKIGDSLLKYVIALAKEQGYERITIEVSANDKRLVDWYQSRCFQIKERLPNYYEEGVDGLRMEHTLDAQFKRKETSNIIVINNPNQWNFSEINAKVISVKEYIEDPFYSNAMDLRIFNLCSSYRYQSYGYYVSLLASARGQKIIPSTIAIRDFKIFNVIQSAAHDLDEIINKSLIKISTNVFSLNIYFGQCEMDSLNLLSARLHKLFEVPLFRVNFIKLDRWIIKELEVLTLKKLPEKEIENVYEFAKKYFNKKRFTKTKLVNYKYHIAVLVNPKESTPPSGPEALEKFKKAANKKGLYLEFITKADLNKINEFDALFIRETTNVNDHTYEFSRMAYAEGLIVIDDPWSILKCSNKIYQNEIFKKHKILTPQTTIITKNLFNKKSLEKQKYPMVLKQPDSAFSLGITKVESPIEALAVLKKLFKKSDMVVCQEFLYSDYDWRVGVLDNKALFACKYYMSKGHWQIYNWKGVEENEYGKSETLSIEEVPANVIKTAVKAAALFGDGLYGVDLKMVNGKIYVVEVNDNPNIDVNYEDKILKDKLYDSIIESIYNRIEIAKNIQKLDFSTPSISTRKK